MSELGDLLELLHGARGRVSTVRATVRMWHHVARMHEAMRRRGNVVAYGPVDSERERESVVRVWLAPPDRAREERDDEGYSVRRGEYWWTYAPHNGAWSNEGRPETGSGHTGEELWWLLDPAPVIGLLDYRDIGRGEHAGRATLRVRAVPRGVDEWALARLAADGADELRLEIDAERGALLRIESRLGGQPYAIYETLAVAFDEPFADDVFVFTPPPGEEVRPAGEFMVERDLTIEQAVARAPFTIWIPSRMPAGWESDVAFAARPPSVHIHYRARDATHAIHVSESPADAAVEHGEFETGWEEIHRNEQTMEIREPAESWQPAQLRVERDGTQILMQSNDLPVTALADLAGALVPAPADPPDLGR